MKNYDIVELVEMVRGDGAPVVLFGVEAGIQTKTVLLLRQRFVEE
jgi:hypothetical protein